MSKSFIHQHIKNIQKQRDSSVSSVPVKTTPITPIAINQDNITSSNLTVVIKEISRIKEAQQTALKIEEDRLAKEKEITALAEAERLKLEQLKLEQEAAEKERIRQEQLAQKQEEARSLRESQERRLAELERERLAQEQLRQLEEERLFKESQERLAREAEERRIRLEQVRIAGEIEERDRLEQERLVQEPQAAQLLQPVQILAPEISVELPVLELSRLEEVQPQLLPPLHIEEQPAEIIAAALEPQPLEHQQEEIIEPVIIPDQAEVMPLIEIHAEVQYIEEHHLESETQGIQEQLVMEAQGGGEENDSEDLDRASDFSNVSGSEEWEYVGLAGEHQEL